MNLSEALRKANIMWSIDQVVLMQESRRQPGTFYECPKTRVRFADWTSVGGLKAVEIARHAALNPNPNQPQPVKPLTLEMLYPISEYTTVNKLLALALKDLLPEHALRRAYLDSTGNTPVTINVDSLGENLGEVLHVQLRKCIDSKQSVIQWNAVHHLLPQDWTHILSNVRENLDKLLMNTARVAVPSRRSVGLSIKEAMTSRMDEVTRRVEDMSLAQKRTELQAFALKSLEAANWLTEDSEWAHGWTSYLCEDAPALEAEENQSEFVAPGLI